jgi:hypothetical protein
MATYYSPRIVTDGLVLCLDAGNIKSYPGTGTTWSDLVSNLSAVKGGSQSPTYPQYNSNSSNGWFTFTGGVVANNYSRFDVANIPSFSALSAFAWFRTTNTTDSKTIIRMDNSDFELSMNQSSSAFVCAGTNWNDIAVQQTAAGTDGIWHEIGLTFTGAVLTAYFDGSSLGVANRATSTTTAAGTLKIGTRDDGYAQHYVGDISVIKIYNIALNSAQVLANYNASKGRFGR